MQPSQMNASAFFPATDRWELRTCQVEIPDVPDGSALLKVSHCGICGSDLRRYRTFTSSKPRTSSEHSPVPGHEFVGWIERGGPAANIGKLAVVNPLVGCETCFWCKQGRTNLCERGAQVIGYHFSGGFAEYCSVPLGNLVLLDAPSDSISRYAMAEPFAVAVNAAMYVCTQSTGPVLVIGDGTIGVLTAWVLTHELQRDVILLGRHQHRLNRAKQLGISAIAGADKLPISIFARIVVASGSQTGFDLGLKLLDKAGQLIFLGYLNENDTGMTSEQLNAVVRSGVSIQGSFGYSQAVFKRAVKLLESEFFNEECVIDRIVGLDELPHAMKLIAEGKLEGLKVLVDPTS